MKPTRNSDLFKRTVAKANELGDVVHVKPEDLMIRAQARDRDTYLKVRKRLTTQARAEMKCVVPVRSGTMPRKPSARH
ncbi:hypothetical protein E3D03_017410 [Paracoccus sp. DMF]|nr:hypothetical protein [Paracoccus sp. DMF]